MGYNYTQLEVQKFCRQKLNSIVVPLFVCVSLRWCWSRSFCFWIAPWYWRCFFLGHFWPVVSGNLGKKEWQNLRGAKSGAARWTCPTMFAFASDTLSSFRIRILSQTSNYPWYALHKTCITSGHKWSEWRFDVFPDQNTRYKFHTPSDSLVLISVINDSMINPIRSVQVTGFGDHQGQC